MSRGGNGGYGGPNGGGGGGLGAGGAIFVQSGGRLILEGGTISGNSVVGGLGGAGGVLPGQSVAPASTDGGAGQAYGAGIFFQGNGAVTFSPGAGQTSVVDDVIADMTGSKDASGLTGALELVKSGVGGLDLNANNTFSGGVTVQSGTLELGTNNAAGGGAVAMDAGTTLTFKADDLIVANKFAIAGDPTFDVATGQTETISGVISDSGATPGVVEKTGGGTLTLSADNTFSGGAVIAGGTLKLGAADSAGSGPIQFAGGADGTLEVAASAPPANMITGFAVGDKIFLDGVDATPGTYANGKLSLSDGATPIQLAVNDPGSQGANDFSISYDQADNKTIIQAVPHTFIANNIADLNTDIATVHAAGANSGAELIKLGADIYLNGTALKPINLAAGVSLGIDGGGHALNGGGNERGLFVYSGSVDVRNLTIEDMLAQDGNGVSGGAYGGGGGGGAGLGGGLFVANDPNGPGPAKVTLTNVGFKSDAARGGAGGYPKYGTNAIPTDPGAGGGMGVTGLPGGFAGNPAPGQAGGFGQGGGAAAGTYATQPGNKGGFGGGGGVERSTGHYTVSGVPYTRTEHGIGGAGGFGGASGSDSGEAGGGGLGAGADVFVMQGASLTIKGGQIGVGTVSNVPEQPATSSFGNPY